MDRRILIAIAAIVIVVGVIFVVKSQSSGHTAQHLTFNLVVKGGTTLTPGDITVTKGDTVTLRVTSDTALELHVHGYNYKLQLKPGKTTGYTFTANVAGSFEMENEGKSIRLGTLIVNP